MEPERSGGDFEIISCKTEEEAQETIARLVLEYKDEDLICLTPTKNENVALGTVQLNKLIQALEVVSYNRNTRDYCYHYVTNHTKLHIPIHW